MKQQNEERAILKMLCHEQALKITDPMIEQLVDYRDYLEQWNKKINLISRKEDAPVLIKHIFHSLLITLYHKFFNGEQILDLGTGGGLPGIPLAIINPDTNFVLVDATRKKITACQAMIDGLKLKNVVAIHMRVEEIKEIKFDTIVSRQVAPLDKLCAWAGSLLQTKGSLICLKGGNLEEEIKRSILGRKSHNNFPLQVDLYPIDGINQFFTEKQIVIAKR